MSDRKLFTSESVTEGHPDKVCDQISDAVLDAVLKQDPDGRVACECCCTTGMVVVMGEISTKAKVDYAAVARKTLKEIGYDGPNEGFDADGCAVLVAIDEQSPDIALGANEDRGGAGDQGMMFGYACDETPDLMPLPITLANKLAFRMSQARKSGDIPFIRPDGKTQVTVEYGPNGRPSRIDTIVISTQHTPDVSHEELVDALFVMVVDPVLAEMKEYAPEVDTVGFRLMVNPTGRFVKGGPAADSGLTGRKIIVDTYGGYAAHGGGAFSGKDPSKVDRSAAYMARYIAKNIVAGGIAGRCQVQLAYAIGVPEPVSVLVETYGTSKYSDRDIRLAVRQVFDLTPKGIIKKLALKQPKYKATAAYGHFGNTTGQARTWELTDMVSDLHKALKATSSGVVGE